MRKGLTLLLCLLISFGFTFQSVAYAKSSDVKTIYSPKSLIHYGGNKYVLKKLVYPKTVTVKLSNGKKTKRSVKWNKVRFDQSIIGKKQKISGVIKGTSKRAFWYVTIRNHPIQFSAPSLPTIGKNQTPTLPKRLPVLFADGKRASYSLKWSKVSTSTLGTKFVNYSASGKNSIIKGKAKLVVSDVLQKKVSYTVFSAGRRVLASGQILHPAKGMSHHLRLVDASNKVLLFPIKLDKKGNFQVETDILPLGVYKFSILSGSKSSTSVSLDIKDVVTVPSEEDTRILLRNLLDAITVSNPLIENIRLPEIEGVSFMIESADDGISTSGAVTRADNNRSVDFTIKASLRGVEEERDFSNIMIPKKDLTDSELLDFTVQNFDIENPLINDIVLPQAKGTTFQLNSSNEKVVSSDGKIHRGLLDQILTITLKGTNGSLEKSKTFSNILVPKAENATEVTLDDYLNRLDIQNPLTQDIVLPSLTGALLTITSTNPDVLSTNGKLTRGLTDQNISFLISATKDGVTKTRSFWNQRVPKRDTATDELLSNYLEQLNIKSPLTQDIVLPQVDGITATLSSTDTTVLANTGKLSRGLTDKIVSLTVTAVKDGVSKTRSFPSLIVPKKESATDEILNEYLNKLDIKSPLTQDIVLPQVDGITATLSSTDPTVLANTGKLSRGLTDKTVSLTVTAIKDGVSKTRSFPSLMVPKKEGATDEILNEYLNKLDIKSPLTQDIVLPQVDGITATLSSTDTTVLSNTGKLSRGLTDKIVSLTVTAAKDGVLKTRTFSDLKVPLSPSSVDIDRALSDLALPSLNQLTGNITLPTTSSNGLPIQWSSDSPNVISNSGVISKAASDRSFTLTATITKDGLTKDKSFSGSVKFDASLSFKEDLSKIRTAQSTLYVVNDLTLPTILNGNSVQWSSNNPSLFSNTGKVERVNQDTMFTLTASYSGMSDVLTMSTQDTRSGLLSSLLSNLVTVLGKAVNPLVDNLAGGSTSDKLPSEYGGLLGIEEKSISQWNTSHPDLVKINGHDITIVPDSREHLVLLYAQYQGITKPVPTFIKIPAKL